MKEIAVIGFGVVGGGVVSMIQENAAAVRAAVGDDVRVKYILDLRDFPDSPYADRVVHDIEPLLSDPAVSLIVETMGGVEPARTYSMAALQHGKHVVTSNKELVAHHGVDLMREAEKQNVAYLYEASVGGGIPVIRPMRTSLRGDDIVSVHGILNGTTNYILTRMRDDGVAFAEALAEAQRLGYAERIPTADVDGFDAQRKIMILTAVATGCLVQEKDVYTETMTRLTVEDMDAARRLGGAVRLIGSFVRNASDISVSVCPRIVPSSQMLAHIDDVYNGISVAGRISGDVLFYGRGAGRFPTAGAVVSDIISALNGAFRCEGNRVWQEAPAGFVRDFSESVSRMYVRVSGAARTDVLESAALLFGDITVPEGTPDGKTEFVTPAHTEGMLQTTLSSLPGTVESVIRMLD